MSESIHERTGRLGAAAAAKVRANPPTVAPLPTNPPPRVTPERWAALLAECSRLDAIANRGAAGTPEKGRGRG